jgi:acyl carrier protein
MTNLEKYNQLLADILQLNINEIKYAEFKKTPSWDSIGHMTLVASLEDSFDILLETEDLMAIKSYQDGIEILSKNYKIKF